MSALCILFTAAEAQSSKYPQLIIGKWVFESFRFPNFIDPKSERVRVMTTAFKGVTYTFTADKKFTVTKAGSSKVLIRGTYRFIKNNHYIMVKYTGANTEEEVEIDYLTEERLNMYVNENGGPVGYFVRVKTAK